MLSIISRSGFHSRSIRTRIGALASLVLISLALFACNPEDNGEEPGELILGLTDAKGDFIHYAVDVTQIKLQKANGAIVDVLPASTRVDFAEYTDMTEFLTAAMIPSGVYTRAQIYLDYSNAEIWVEGDNGEARQVQTVLDENGSAITQLTAKVHLEGINRLLIAPGTPAHMTLDFDLNASNQVSFDALSGEPSIVVEPLLSADLELQRPKIHRLRGPLQSVDSANGSFRVILRPFYASLINDARFGSIAVQVASTTEYDIDGEQYSGADGLNAMAQLPQYSAVVVRGALKLNPRRFVAAEVYAGSSVPGGSSDVVAGHVISRAANTLTIKGPTLIRAGGDLSFGQTVQVTVADTTLVRKQGSREPLDIAAISVGQRIAVFGDADVSAGNTWNFDASNGLARLYVTNLRATSVSLPTANQPYLNVDLQYVDRRDVSLFDFTGTGKTGTEDAQASNYEVNVGTLDLSMIADNTPLRVMGFVHRFGDAPADFDALSVTDLSQLPAGMALSYENANANPFSDSSDQHITLDINGAGRFHHFSQAGIRLDMNSMPNPPTLVARPLGVGVFVIAEGEQRKVYLSFANWVSAMQEKLSNGSLLKGVKAVGQLDNEVSELTVRAAKAIFQ